MEFECGRMAKKKVYAVKKGKATGIFESWEDCRASVEGYPGAEYKGFPTRGEALAYMEDREPEEDILSQVMDEAKADRLTAYVDGSFDAKLKRYSFGCVILLPSGEIIRESGNGDNPESAALRNVTGEMLGAMFAVKWCAVNGYPAIRICYDYMGIEMWATGAWRAKTDLTQKYAQFMRNYMEKLDISFRKIAAHTGDTYNEEADRLAKKALVEGEGIPVIRRMRAD